MTGSRDTFLSWMDHSLSKSDDAPISGGSILAPTWIVVLAGATVVLSGLSYFFWRIRRARRAPKASRPSVKHG